MLLLSPTGGITPYTWGLKAGSPPLPSGLTLTSNGIISGEPTVTSNATHTFTLSDATSLTVEKALQLSIRAIPLSITNTSLPQGTANQSYSATLTATGGTGAYTWGLAGGSPALPTGLTLNPSTGEISGVPTSTSSRTLTFTVTDQTPPTPQSATKTLLLIIGGAPPNLIITTNSPLPAGTMTQPYSAALTSSGGTGIQTWDISSGSLPAGLNLSSSGVISGTPTTTGTSSPTFRVRDSGNPQQTPRQNSYRSRLTYQRRQLLRRHRSPQDHSTWLTIRPFRSREASGSGLGYHQRVVTTRARPQCLERQYFRYTDQHRLVQFCTASHRSDSAIRSAELYDRHQRFDSAIYNQPEFTTGGNRESAISQHTISSHWRYTTLFLVSESCFAERSYSQSIVRCHQRNTFKWK